MTTTPAERTLLLVDDDDDLVRVLSRAFQQAGWTVHTARDGREGVALAGSLTSLDAAVVDMVLPGTGGLDVVRAIRGAHPACRILAMTGVLSPGLEQAFLAAGADRFLSKPVDLDVLLKAVGR